MTVSFTGSGSTDDGSIESYSWDFGDGATSTDADPEHTYTAIGTYTAELTVTDDGGATDSASVVISVTDPNAPDADQVAYRLNVGGGFVASGDSGPDWQSNEGFGSTSGVGYQVNTGNISPTSGTMLYANRDTSIPEYIGSGVFASVFGEERWDLGDAPEMEFSIDLLPGNYQVNLYMGNSFSGTDGPGDRVFGIELEGTQVATGVDLVSLFGHRSGGMLSYPVTVADGSLQVRFLHEVENPLVNGIEIVALEGFNFPPDALLDASPESGDAPLTVSFTGSGSTDDGSIESYSWDFGDGATSTDADPEHTYTAIGTYTAELTVTDDGGATDSASVVISVSSDGPDVNDDDLIVHLNFEESGGITAFDDSGFGNNFTIIERDDFANPVLADDHTWGRTGIYGNSLELDGRFHNSNSILELPYNSIIDDIRTEITVAAWIWRDAGSIVPQIGKPANVAVFAHDYPAIFGGFHNWLVKWSFATTDGFVDCYAGHAPLDQWTHFAITYDGQRAKLFANGIEVCNKPITGNIRLRNDSSPNSRFNISGFYEHRTDLPVVPFGNQSAITDELDGRMDDYRIYRRALSSQEVENIYLEGLASGTTGIPDCRTLPITAEYKIGSDGTWTVGNDIVAPLGSRIFIRARNYGAEYFISTNAFDGPTISSVNNTDKLTFEGAYQIDTDVFDFGDPSRNDGIFDIHNVGQYALTTTNGCSTVINLIASNASLQTSTTNFQDLYFDQVLIAPNPSSSQVQLYFPKGVQSGTVSLFDINGRLLEVIAEGELFSPVEFSVEKYPSGTYMLVLELKDERISRPLLINR